MALIKQAYKEKLTLKPKADSFITTNATYMKNSS